jgi:signal peptidase I
VLAIEIFMDNDFINRLDQTRIIPNSQFSSLMEDIIKRGKEFRFRASGHSMAPFINNHDVLTFSTVNSKPIDLGDVIAFLHQKNNNLIVHRVVASKADSYLIKGDNSARKDGWIKRDQIIGKVIKVERDGKAVKFGLGKEKALISIMSRVNFLILPIKILRNCLPGAYKNLFK